ncbi:hypothetical protein A8713_30745 [Streptomyces sp. SAT1]|nr:hypothetical protein A8713_30745 [Streptomyces sp. SAT1]
MSPCGQIAAASLRMMVPVVTGVAPFEGVEGPRTAQPGVWGWSATEGFHPSRAGTTDGAHASIPMS